MVNKYYRARFCLNLDLFEHFAILFCQLHHFCTEHLNKVGALTV